MCKFAVCFVVAVSCNYCFSFSDTFDRKLRTR